MRKSLIYASLAIGVFAVPAAQAVPVVTWSYTVDSVWNLGAGAPTFSAGTLNATTTATEISWGADLNGGAAGNGTLAVGVERSGVLIENAPQSGQIDTNGVVPQATNTFSHVNNPLDASYATLLTAGITTTLNLTPFLPSGLALPTKTLTFNINFMETSNDGSCVVGATSNCDDVFVISFGSLNNTFDYDGSTYYSSIVKTTGPLDPLSASACAEAGVAAGCLGFLTAEGAKTSVDFGILITSAPINVPEPGVLGLLGLGLLGLLGSRRMKKLPVC